MTDRDTLLALAERVEGLPAEWTVDYRSTGKEIHRSIFGAPEVVVHSGYGWREDDRGWWMLTDEDGRIPPKRIDPAKWLTSIDAALRLVPAGWTIANFSQGDDGLWWCEIREGYLTSYNRVAISALKIATPALAVTAAALRARAGGL